ncbi:DNA topoisomerase III [Sulfuriroseicoccus oceanibius]|uniref:DNA topoisomerase n=1 Tax=Sulfuriroseicoccus oceanibius TaxID=2707525 RepID=A0A6B3LAB9_9BACT|nr:DNA topoisomerase III [Sulfuriroseicoccus oceanibius]QQL46162.1 DNA topoisomerase III [Sulfuriroseicoccus oceanibius]
MGKKLIIAEKPSVATDLARVLSRAPGMSKFEKKKDYFESDEAIITSAVGHLVELKMPEGPNGKKLPWGFKHLPVVPKHFDLQPIDKSKDRLRQVVRLAKSKAVDEIINACDAGREGELIFRYIMDIGKIKKPTRRLWMQSMTNDAILDAWSQLRDADDMAPLGDAAICRSESDWLVGLNGTRAITAYNSRNGGFNLTPAGRVQTPTLSILAKREREIQKFKAEPYYEVHGVFGVQAGQYDGRWFDESFKKSDIKGDQKRAERIWSRDEAQAVVERCSGKTGEIEEKKKPVKQAAPLLYDLTTLQREAGNRFGFSARRTLQLAQALYERYKVLTYPRTDSRYLPEDYLGTVRETMATLSQSGGPNMAQQIADSAAKALDDGLIKPSKRIFNNAKVSDHFAIIPTGKSPVKMDDDAQKLFELVTRRFIAVFYPSAEFEVTNRITRIRHSASAVDAFKTDGRILVVPGWLAVYGRTPGAAAEKDEMVAVTSGESASVDDLELRQNETRPPARYTEATLLSAMEGAGKLVEDEELREAMSERGLGTPATRAAIIEGLIRQKYLVREKRDLIVTAKGMALVNTLQDMQVEALTSPEMTGDWEYKLKQMEQGKLDRETFMNEIKDFAAGIVERCRDFTDAAKNRVFPAVEVPCPKCQTAPLKQTDSTYECQNPECSWRMGKHIASREITPAEVQQLLTTKLIGPLTGFKSRFGKDFDAALSLNDELKVAFVFENDDRAGIEDEIKESEQIGEATLADGTKTPLLESERAYLCPGLTTKNDPKGVRVSKVILSKNIPKDQALKLFNEHKTDLMQGFVSKKGRKFGAHLTLDTITGKVGFEFVDRKPAAKKTTAKKATAKKAAKKKK